MKFTKQKIKKDLIKNHPAILAHFKVDENDREYKFRGRNTLIVELRTAKIFQ